MHKRPHPATCIVMLICFTANVEDQKGGNELPTHYLGKTIYCYINWESVLNFFSYPLCFQPYQLPQGLYLQHFSFQDSSSTSHGMSLHCTWMKQLMPTLSTSLVPMTCVGMATDSREWLNVATRVQCRQHHRWVTHTLSQWQQPTVAGAWEDPRVHLCFYKVHRGWSYMKFDHW